MSRVGIIGIGHGVFGRYPMQRAFDLAAVRCVTAPRLRIIGAAQFDDLAPIVLLDAGAGDIVSADKSHFATRSQPEEFNRRILEEVLSLNE